EPAHSLRQDPEGPALRCRGRRLRCGGGCRFHLCRRRGGRPTPEAAQNTLKRARRAPWCCRADDIGRRRRLRHVRRYRRLRRLHELTQELIERIRIDPHLGDVFPRRRELRERFADLRQLFLEVLGVVGLPRLRFCRVARGWWLAACLRVVLRPRIPNDLTRGDRGLVARRSFLLAVARFRLVARPLRLGKAPFEHALPVHQLIASAFQRQEQACCLDVIEERGV